jgi:hypothetical protein
MNLDKWEVALKENGLFEQYGDVLNNFKTGFNQGIPKHSMEGMRWFTPDNHTSVTAVQSAI